MCSQAVCTVIGRLLHSTAGAMQGNLSYRASLEARLNIFRPSHTALDEFIAKNPPAFTPKVEYVYIFISFSVLVCSYALNKVFIFWRCCWRKDGFLCLHWRLAAEGILSSGRPCVCDHKLKVCESIILQTACGIFSKFQTSMPLGTFRPKSQRSQGHDEIKCGRKSTSGVLKMMHSKVTITDNRSGEDTAVDGLPLSSI